MELYGLVVKGRLEILWLTTFDGKRGNAMENGFKLFIVLFLMLGDGYLLYYSLYFLYKYFTKIKKKRTQVLDPDRTELKS